MRLSALFAAIVISGTTASAADPLLMNFVMPDARVLAGVNVTATEISPLGQFLLARVQPNGASLQAVAAATGFNPFTDVAEILAASSGDPAKPGILVLVRGNFKVDQIAAALAGKGAQTQTYDGATLITFTNRRRHNSSALAFVGDTIAVVGSTSIVEAALDRNSSGANSIDTQLAVKIKSLSALYDEWIVSSEPLADLVRVKTGSSGPGALVVPFLKDIQSFSVGAQFDANVSLAVDLVTSDAKTADALGNVVRFLIGFAGSGSGNPELASLLKLLRTATITTNGADVNLALTVPEATFESFINSIPPHTRVRNGN